MADPKAPALRSAKTLRELMAVVLAEPMQFEPGSTWRYTSSAFNVAGLIVEVVSGQPFDAFLQDRLFTPLGMNDTTFYPNDDQRGRLAHAYRANPATGALTLVTGLGANGPIPAAGQPRPWGRAASSAPPATMCAFARCCSAAEPWAGAATSARRVTGR